MGILNRSTLPHLLALGCLACSGSETFPVSHTTLKARFSQPDASSYLELTDQQVAQVISELRIFISKNQPFITSQFDAYYFQLTAYKSSGRNFVHINAFHQNALKYCSEWRTSPVSVKGGGNDFWKARYSLDTRSVIELWANADK